MRVNLNTDRMNALGLWNVLRIFCLATIIKAEIRNVRIIIVADKRSKKVWVE